MPAIYLVARYIEENTVRFWKRGVNGKRQQTGVVYFGESKRRGDAWVPHGHGRQTGIKSIHREGAPVAGKESLPMCLVYAAVLADFASPWKYFIPFAFDSLYPSQTVPASLERMSSYTCMSRFVTVKRPRRRVLGNQGRCSSSVFRRAADSLPSMKIGRGHLQMRWRVAIGFT